MFSLHPPAQNSIEDALALAQKLDPPTPDVLDVHLGLKDRIPLRFSHDRSRSELGIGADVFALARKAFTSWAEFNLGWVRVVNPAVPILEGETVAVLAHAAGLWSLNLSRITQVVDTPTHFGFLYATTSMHVEEGQERFLIEFDPNSGLVSYLIEAISRPRHPLARFAYPFTRAMQHRFVRDSHTSLRQAVTGALH